MKNLVLFVILTLLISLAYILDHKKEQFLFKEIKEIKTQNYTLFKKNDHWFLGTREIQEDFISNYIDILKSIKIISNAEEGKVISEISIDDKKYALGEKLFSANGFKLKIQNEWYVVKNTFSRDLLYKDENDLANKQYQMIKNIFNFSAGNIKLK